MNQINVSPPGTEPVDTSADRAAAAGINLITMLIVFVVLAIIAWYLFTGPLRSVGASSSTTNINVNPAPTTVNVSPTSAPNNPTPGGGTGSSNPPSNTNPAPSKP